MSKDLRIKNVCPHQVIEEWLAIDTDRQTLRTVRYPSSSQVKMLWNRTLVPKQGLYSTVEVTGLQIEPFEIETGDNDTLSFSVDGGITQTITLPTGTAVTAASVVRSINGNASGIVATVTGGRVTLRHDRSNAQSTFKFEGGNGHTTLGFSELRFYRSRQIIPGWEIIGEANNVDPTARVIRFNEALHTDDDIFEVSYFTVRGVCRRCQGLGVENDFRHDRQGNPVFVQNQRLLLQEVEKIIFTIRGSNVFHNWYGTSLADLIGTKIVGGGRYLETQLVSEISNAIDKYQQIKDQQGRFQPVTRRELLQRVVSVNVAQDSKDPTVFFVDMVLESQSGELEQIQDTIVLPDASFASGFQRIR